MIVQPLKVQVLEEGVSQGYIGELDFAGASVTAAVSGNRATITVTSGPGGGDPSYAPGSFTLATGTFRVQVRRLTLTGSQRATLQGTACLRGI